VQEGQCVWNMAQILMTTYDPDIQYWFMPKWHWTRPMNLQIIVALESLVFAKS
jgi:hypothetical protein